MPLALVFPFLVIIILGAYANGHRKRRDDDDWPSGAARA